MSKRQKTLFESWNKSSTNNTSYPSTSTNANAFANTNSPSDFSTFQRPSKSRESNLDSAGFDPEAGKTWIYPTNYPIREYQFSIVQEALFKNTLVILPTGLGKTFIAAVVMFNIYRWYPNGKVVFMAPTRPLVAQQIDACHKVTGIPMVDTTQMTGTNLPEERKRMWSKKRVFFLTPQVLVNDLVRNICPASSIKCLVVDEAHKALGNQAYCQVIRELIAFTDQFRVLALTATPGSDTQAVKMVISNLLISHVEMRTEESEDVKPYTHNRDIEKIIVPLGDKLTSVKSRFLDVINIYLKRLNQRKAIGLKNPSSLSKFQVLKMREDFSQRPPDNIDKFSYGLALADFSLCISLYHAYELLLLHGARPFYNFLTGIVNGEKSIPHARSEMLKNYEFKELMKEVERDYIPVQNNQDSNASAVPHSVLPGHPKLEKLLEVVLAHFKNVNKESAKSTRVMIFSQYRDSVDEIVEMLNYHRPMIKAMSFIGQTTKSGSTAGFSQKHQLKVLQEFRSGGYNTLVSTCVGEEGLDIGEVDLIVCYDCPKSPIRLVQRMGRTGRLRKGSIIILVAEGKEEQMLSSCESKKKSIHKAITKGFSFAQLYSNSPSLLPPGLKPVCVKTSITVEAKKVERIKSKGKCEESPFLNAEEMDEYNSRFKFPKSDLPLLPDSKMVSLSNPVQEDQLAESRLSLSNWMLWQTAPQRIHQVSHSSRSLLLVNIVDKINFSRPPDIEQDDNPPAASIVNDVDVPITIDLCSDDENAVDFCKAQRNIGFEIVDLDISPLKSFVKDGRDSFKQLTSDRISSLALNVNKEDTLLKTLFGISFTHLPKMSKECTFEDPPSIELIMSIGKLPTICMEDFPIEKSENRSKFNIFSKKMEAEWKRKSKELGFDLSFSDSKVDIPEKWPNDIVEELVDERIIMESVPESPINAASFDVSVPSNREINNSPVPNADLKSITFDIDFDIPLDFDNSENKENIPDPVLAPDCDQKDSPFEINTESSMLSEDASMIVDQLLSSREDVQDNLDSSFAVPLTVKKVILENHCDSPSKDVAANPSLSSQRRGISPRASPMKVSTSITKDTSSPSPSLTLSPWRLGKMLDTEEKVSEPTQCTMTQLLSLINTSGLTGNVLSPQKNPESPKKRKIESSEDEIEPTPPRGRRNRGVGFCYRSSSFRSESEPTQMDGFDENDDEADSSNHNLNEAIYFDLSEFSPGDFLGQTPKRGPSVSSLKLKVNSMNATPKEKCCIISNRDEKLVSDNVSHKDTEESETRVIPEKKNIPQTNDPKIEAHSKTEAETPHSTSFERVFFDISFDIPGFEEVCASEYNSTRDAVRMNSDITIQESKLSDKAIQIVDLTENNEISIDDREPSLMEDTDDSFIRKSNHCLLKDKRNQVESRDLFCSGPSTSKTNVTSKKLSTNMKTKATGITNHSDKIFRDGDYFSKANECEDFKFKVPNCKAKVMFESQKPDQYEPKNSQTHSYRSSKIEFDLSDFSCEPESESLLKPSETTQKQVMDNSKEFDDFFCEPESESLIKQSETTQKQVLNDSPEFEDFAKPMSKNNIAKKPVIVKNKKVKKKSGKRSKNMFMLSQVDVSGSDSTGDSVSCDEDLDALEDSFIDDGDDTLCESPKSEHGMYLQSVKNVAGLPQRFKFKENLNLNHSVYSQPVDEGCSKYLLDSFCVDDECVTYSSSDEEVEHRPKTPMVKSKKKRKRIVAASSSDEEVFVKKVRTSAGDELPGVANSQESPIRTFKRIPSKRILSSDDDASYSEKKCNTSSRSILGGENQFSLNQKTSVTAFDSLQNPKSSNTTEGAIEMATELGKTNNESVENFNISFDIGWDDFSPDPVEINNPFKSKDPATSVSLNENKEQPIVSKQPNQEREFSTMDQFCKQPPMKRMTSLALPSPIPKIPSPNSHSSALSPNISSLTFANTTINPQNAQRTSSPFRPAQPSNTMLSPEFTSTKPNASCTINTTENATACSPNLNRPFAGTILVDSRELASGKPVISALRNKHRVNPVVMQLNSADYIISNKVAVERVFDSEFSSNNMPAKVLEKVKAMSELYEKSFVIVEADSRKKILGFNKLSTKYLHFSVCASLSNVRMVYSRSFEESSDILFDMIQKETSRGFHITVPVTLNTSNQKVFDFYQSIPGVSTICALNFVYHFPVVHMIFQASVGELKKVGFISTRKAQSILEYLGCEMSFTSFS